MTDTHEAAQQKAETIVRDWFETQQGSLHLAHSLKLTAAIAAALAEKEREWASHYFKTAHEVEQILGKALGYPEADESIMEKPDGSVVVGDHVPESLADEAALRIKTAEAKLAKVRREAENLLTVLEHGGGNVKTRTRDLEIRMGKLRAALREGGES